LSAARRIHAPADSVTAGKEEARHGLIHDQGLDGGLRVVRGSEVGTLEDGRVHGLEVSGSHEDQGGGGRQQEIANFDHPAALAASEWKRADGAYGAGSGDGLKAPLQLFKPVNLTLKAVAVLLSGKRHRFGWAREFDVESQAVARAEAGVDGGEFDEAADKE